MRFARGFLDWNRGNLLTKRTLYGEHLLERGETFGRRVLNRIITLPEHTQAA